MSEIVRDTEPAKDSSLKVKKYPPGKHPNSRKNLITYPKGVSGNQGSGKGYSLTSELKHALNKETRTALIQSTIEGAIKREVTPFKEVWDRVEGKVIDRTDHTFNGEGLSDVLGKLRGYNLKELKEGENDGGEEV